MTGQDGQLLDAAQYEKLTGKTYKQQRTMREKGIGRWTKVGKKYQILVKPADVIPGIDNEHSGLSGLRPADPHQPELPVADTMEDWKLRKLKAEALLKEQQNDAFLFKLLSDFSRVFSESMVDCLQPIRQVLVDAELTPEQAAAINQGWVRFGEEWEDRLDKDVTDLLNKYLGVES